MKHKLTISYEHDGSNADIGKMTKTVIVEADRSPAGIAQAMREFLGKGSDEDEQRLAAVLADMLFETR